MRRIQLLERLLTVTVLHPDFDPSIGEARRHPNLHLRVLAHKLTGLAVEGAFCDGDVAGARNISCVVGDALDGNLDMFVRIDYSVDAFAVGGGYRGGKDPIDLSGAGHAVRSWGWGGEDVEWEGEEGECCEELRGVHVGDGIGRVGWEKGSEV